MKKKIIYILIIIFAYYFLSVYFTKNGQFIQDYSTYSSSKKESIEKNIYLTDNVKILILKDSSDIIKNSFDIWVDKREVTKRYGILPIDITSIDKSLKGFNINFKDDLNEHLKDTLMLKINNGDLMGNYTILTQYLNPKDDVIIDFYIKKNKNSFGRIKVNIE